MKKKMRCFPPPIPLAVVLALGICGLHPSAVLAGDLTVDNLNVYKDATVYGNLTVIQGNAPNVPRLHYSFDTAPTGGVVVDESLNGNSGAVYGVGTIWTNVSAAGVGSFYFDNSGTGNYVKVNYGSTLQLTGPYTLAAWIKPETPGDAGGPGIMMKTAAGGGASEYGLGWSTSGTLGFYSSGSDSLAYLWTTNSVAPTGVWTHVVGVLEGSGANQAKIYVNGVVVMQGTLRLPSAGGNPLYVGRWRAQYYYKGYIDDPRIYDRALSATDVQQLYSNTLSYAYPTGVVLRVDDANLLLTGNLTVQSNLSAASFSGNASGLTNVGSSGIASGAIANAQLAANAVTSNKLAADVWAANDDRYANITGDTMTGLLSLPSNGLAVGSDQLVMTGGKLGIGTTNPSCALHVAGAARVDGGIVYIPEQGDLSMGSYTNTP